MVLLIILVSRLSIFWSREVIRVEKVDNLIDLLADHIRNLIENEGELEHEVAEKTRALADLIFARAQMP